MALKAPRGTKDILPEDVAYFHMMEDAAREVFGNYGYSEIRTPIFEATNLFSRSIGEETDIVSKEMYTFEDRKGRSMTLRPEGTAPVVRAMIEHSRLKQQGAQEKVYYIGPMFRYERPQDGRQRQFNTAGVEFFGCASPLADAEVIAMLSTYLRRLGFKDPVTKVNSIGNAASREAYNTALRERLAEVHEKLCGDCQRRAQVNPLRVLDCKVPACGEIYKDFPLLGEYLDDESRTHYDGVLRALDALGVRYEKAPGLVRGFDYYTHTVFETALEGLGAQDSVLGGGRYDNLVEQLGGPLCPAVGAGFGLERLVIAMKAAGITPPGAAENRGVTMIVGLEDDCLEFAAVLAQRMRESGRPVVFDTAPRSFKAALRAANKAGYGCLAVIGPEEREKQSVLIKNLESGEQSTVSLDEAVNA